MERSKRTLWVLGFALALFVGFRAVPGQAQEPDTQAEGAALAQVCRGCHGHGSGLGTLAELEAEALLQTLRAFRADPDHGTLMPRLVRGYSDAELKTIAAVLTGEKPHAR